MMDKPTEQVPVQEPPKEADPVSALSSVMAYERSERAAALATACTQGMGITEADIERVYAEFIG